jgi:methylated-DNA-[protein]-cysteine S-methyltransferase
MDSEDMTSETAFFNSPVGCIELTGVDGVVTGLYFRDVDHLENIPESLAEAVSQLKSYFSGDFHKFNIPVKPSGTPFQLKVWQILLEIPYGKTISYGDIANRMGIKNGARAVGLANGSNPVSIIIPCHRVIGANGKLTGYGGGLWRKEWLLKLEKSNSGEGLFQ